MVTGVLFTSIFAIMQSYKILGDDLNLSNSRGLKLGLYKDSHIPKNSIVLRLRSQLPITAFGSSLLWLAKSVKEI